MKIENRDNNITFNRLFPKKIPVDKKARGELVIENIRNDKKLKDGLNGDNPPMFLKVASKMMKKLIPFVESKVINPSKKDPSKGKITAEDLVNGGNIAKELVCMIVYPVQVLTNPDLPKDKRRFIGVYDFFVTCVSLAGTILFAWKGKAYSKVIARKMLSKTIKLAEKDGKVKALVKKLDPKNPNGDVKAYPRLERAIAGGAFVLGLLGQTILFKRLLAPALAPLGAAKVRTVLEERDAKKAKANDKISNIKNDAVVSKTDAKWEETMPVSKTTPWLLVAH